MCYILGTPVYEIDSNKVTLIEGKGKAPKPGLLRTSFSSALPPLSAVTPPTHVSKIGVRTPVSHHGGSLSRFTANQLRALGLVA